MRRAAGRRPAPEADRRVGEESGLGISDCGFEISNLRSEIRSAIGNPKPEPIHEAARPFGHWRRSALRRRPSRRPPVRRPGRSSPVPSSPARTPGGASRAGRGRSPATPLARRGHRPGADRRGHPRRVGDRWPDVVVVRLGTRGLEQLTLRQGGVALQASVLSHSGHRQLQHVRRGDKEGPDLDARDPWRATIRAVDADGRPVDGLPPAGGGLRSRPRAARARRDGAPHRVDRLLPLTARGRPRGRASPPLPQDDRREQQAGDEPGEGADDQPPVPCAPRQPAGHAEGDD